MGSIVPKKRKGIGKFLPDDFDYYVHNGAESCTAHITWCPYHKKYIIIKSSDEGYGGSDVETPYCLFCGSHLHQGGEKSHGIPTKKTLEVVGWLDTNLRSKTLRLVLSESFIEAQEDLLEALQMLQVSSYFKRVEVSQVRLNSLQKRKRISLKRYGSTAILQRTIILNNIENIKENLIENSEEKSSKPQPLRPSRFILAFSKRGMNSIDFHLKSAEKPSKRSTKNSKKPTASTSKKCTKDSDRQYQQKLNLYHKKNLSNELTDSTSQSQEDEGYQSPCLMLAEVGSHSHRLVLVPKMKESQRLEAISAWLTELNQLERAWTSKTTKMKKGKGSQSKVGLSNRSV